MNLSNTLDVLMVGLQRGFDLDQPFLFLCDLLRTAGMLCWMLDAGCWMLERGLNTYYSYFSEIFIHIFFSDSS
jgi:hypothetical protein